MPFRRWLERLRPQDAVWLLLFAVMAVMAPGHDPWEVGMLLALAAVQIAENKFPILESARAKAAWIFLKLALGYLLIGYTGGLSSSYYLVLLLPVVSAATEVAGAIGTLLCTLLAAGAYLSFLLFVDWSRFSIDSEQAHELALRIIFLAMAGNLANTLAQAVRVQSGNYQKVAEQLAQANRDLREAEEAVRRSDRLAALGQLSAGLAHELRNPLGTIKASAEMLARSVAGENEVAREVAGFISTEVDRTNSLVTRFLEFARPLRPRLAPADLHQVLDRAASQLQGNVAIFKNYSHDIRPFLMDAELMERVFHNLLINAVQATAEGGAVTVKTRMADAAAEVAVIDRGCGIDPKNLDQIFNPFFTTKPQGVGLGLAIVSKIVDEHGGRMAVESEPGKGSVFRVYLPVRPS